jgi:hypothetical protein
MPLYLDEIYFNIASKDDFKRVCERMNNNMTKGFPPSNAQGGHVVLERGVAKVILYPGHPEPFR